MRHLFHALLILGVFAIVLAGVAYFLTVFQVGDAHQGEKVAGILASAGGGMLFFAYMIHDDLPKKDR